MPNVRLHLLIRPAFLLALLVLLLNDHFLKTAFPGWLTGKLSDFAGLFVLPVLIYAIAGKWIGTNRGLATLHVLIGTAFVIWKIAPIEILFAAISRFLPIGMPGRVKDATDLCALAILPLSYFYTRKFQNEALKGLPSRTRDALAHFMVILSGLAVIATPSGRSYRIEPNIERKTDIDQAKLIALFEEVLAKNGVEIKSHQAKDDTTSQYKIYFKNKVQGGQKHADQEYTSIITLIYSPAARTIKISKIDGWVVHDLPKDAAIDETYLNRIIKPYLRALQKEAGGGQ